MHKDVFVDGHEQADFVEDCKTFLKKMKKLKSYIENFYENGAIKSKTYSLDSAVEKENRQPIIVITHNEYTFSANDRVCREWIRKKNIFLQSKERRQSIITSDFLLLYRQLNFNSLIQEIRDEIVYTTELVETEIVEIFKYSKTIMGIEIELSYINK